MRARTLPRTHTPGSGLNPPYPAEVSPGHGFALRHVAPWLWLIIGATALPTSTSAEPGGAATKLGVSPQPRHPSEKALQGNLGHPYNLPQASRPRIHECSVKWQKMKMAGEAEDLTWRAFASVCFVTPAEAASGASATGKAR